MDLVSEMAAGEEPEGDIEAACRELVADREHGRHRLAHHEGGHLAAAWALDACLFTGNITADGLSGSVRFRLGGDASGASVARTIAILAGPVAERRFAPYGRDSGARDCEMVADQLDALCRDPAAAAIVRRHCEAEAARLVEAEWDLVEAFAAALLAAESLTGTELHEIATEVEQRRSRERWRAIQAGAGTSGDTTMEAACPGAR